MKQLLKSILFLSIIIAFSGFWDGNTPKEDRAEIIKMRDETLNRLLQNDVQAQMYMDRAYGYAVFSNVGVNVVLFSAEGGYGVAHNNLSGENTYMKMASAGAGFGLGVKDFRAVFLFENEEVFNRFVNSGWEANAQADAAAIAGEHGGSISAAITVAPGVKLYKITKNGVAIQATLQGTKYWKDDRLNNE
ncbi:MAG: hypothetical protein ACNI3C_02785 [Candidatus Marinarcus sp.]|uniref:lipid-binding SYLF domain-containing protein n=1 Tax=Candidatus Marinarcus sp. TaxID=3100987 RepID=UPI003B00C4BB